MLRACFASIDFIDLIPVRIALIAERIASIGD
jgi:hypothetical protein